MLLEGDPSSVIHIAFCRTVPSTPCPWTNKQTRNADKKTHKQMSSPLSRSCSLMCPTPVLVHGYEHWCWPCQAGMLQSWGEHPLTAHQPGNDLAAGQHGAALRADGAAWLHGHRQGEQVSPSLSKSDCTANTELTLMFFSVHHPTCPGIHVWVGDWAAGLRISGNLPPSNHVKVTVLAQFWIAKPITEIAWS